MISNPRALTAALTLSLTLALAGLVAAAPAHAQLPPTPGVAFVNQSTSCSHCDPSSYATYIGGPLTANQLDVRIVGPTAQSGRTVTFEQPITLMIPGPIVTAKFLYQAFSQLYQELNPEGSPDSITYQDCNFGLGTATCQVPDACTVGVVTRLGPDSIVLRQNGADPCKVAINSQLGNDVIDSRDGAPTSVFCAGGVDRVLADFGDAVSGTCEVVTRS